MKYEFAETVKVLPILAPIDIVATATNTQYVDLNLCAGLVEIAIPFGAITSTDSTGGVTVTLTSNNTADTSSSDSSEVALAFEYRLSAAVGTDSMGAITAATSSGVEILESVDNKTLLIYYDARALPAADADGRFIRAVITPTAEATSVLVSATARFIPRYAGNAMPSST